MSHLAFLKIPNYHKIIVLTDSGMVLYPTLEQKREIIENAVENLRNMGYDEPKVGILAAVEKVNPKQPETVDAAELTEMYRHGEIKDCIVEGPLSYDILIVGAKAPIALTSRGATEKEKRQSLLLAAACAKGAK